VADMVSERVKELAAQIEQMRSELRRSVMEEGTLKPSESTYSISERLDRLIVEYIRLRDQLSQ
jgi:hypothetical protein